jgi:hypothetical protein
VSEGIDYPGLLRRATLGLVREALELAASEGLPGEHHFFLTFRTTEEGVELPASLARQYPDTMTIVLQHQFWNLDVGDEGFAVTLRFGGQHERLRVPWDALTSFLDPSVPFGLDFTQFTAAQIADAEAAERAARPRPAPASSDEVREVDAAASGTTSDAGDRPGDVLPFRRPAGPRESD